MNARSLAAAAIGLGFVGYLAYSTLRSQQVECRVTMRFDGREQTATASAENQEEAVRQAVTAACGPIAPGMNSSIACSNTPPLEQDCRTL